MKSDKEFVKMIYPEAICIGPVILYWPGTDERTAYLILSSSIMSTSEGSGNTKEEAWHDAASRLRYLGRKQNE